MIRNFIKSSFRSLFKNRSYTLINIVGLTIGISSFMLIVTIIVDEMSFDKFWERSEDIYKVFSYNETEGINQKFYFTSPELGKTLTDLFPEVEQFATMNVGEQRFGFENGDNDGIPVQVINADTNILSMFDFKPINGKMPEFIKGQKNILITESFRNRLFGNDDPVGTIIRDIPSSGRDYQEFLITGIIEDIPKNTHLRAEAVILSPPTGQHLNREGSWGGTRVYYLLKAGTDPVAFTQKLNEWYQDYMQDPAQKLTRFGLQSVTDIYHGSDYDTGIAVRGSRTTMFVLGATGIFLLLIACINYISLTTAYTMRRIKEIGTRKSLGAERRHLIGQFLTDALLFFFIATFLSLIFYSLGHNFIENILGYELSKSIFSDFGLLTSIFFTVIILSISTTAYPTWLFSSLKPSDTLKGKMSKTNMLTTNKVRVTLVVIQFSIAIGIIVSLFIVREQISYINKKDIGYEKENMLHVGLRRWEGKGEAFKTELKNMPGIESVSVAGWNPVDGQATIPKTIDHPLKPGEKIDVQFIVADFDFSKTMGFKLLSGRGLNPEFGTDQYNMMGTMGMSAEDAAHYTQTRSSIITASTAKILGIDETGKAVPNLGFPAVGIIEDFHRESLHHSLEPLFILAESNPDYARLFVRTIPGMQKQAEESLANIWKKFYPNRLLDAHWLSDILNKQYRAEQQQQALIVFFSLLILILCAMGVFGLVLHSTQQRVKEIGIRKVFGASTFNIVALFSADFIKIICASLLIAIPFAWFVMNQWLENFAYRINVEWWPFALAGSLVMITTLITVSWQAIRASISAPITALRDE